MLLHTRMNIYKKKRPQLLEPLIYGPVYLPCIICCGSKAVGWDTNKFITSTRMLAKFENGVIPGVRHTLMM